MSQISFYSNSRFDFDVGAARPDLRGLLAIPPEDILHDDQLDEENADNDTLKRSHHP